MRTRSEEIDFKEKLTASRLFGVCNSFSQISGLGIRIFDSQGLCCYAIGNQVVEPSVLSLLFASPDGSVGSMTPFSNEMQGDGFRCYTNLYGLSEAVLELSDNNQSIGFLIVGQFIPDEFVLTPINNKLSADQVLAGSREKISSIFPTLNTPNLHKTLAFLKMVVEDAMLQQINRIKDCDAPDTTKFEKEERTLMTSSDLNETLLSSIPFGIDIVDEEGNVLFMNNILQKQFAEEWHDKKCWELYRDDATQCINCPLRQPISIGTTTAYESEGVMGGRIFEIHHTGIWVKGKKVLMEIFKDITDRKNVEADLVAARNKAEEVSLFRSRLLSNLSHEIRTPLNGIMGFSEFLKGEITDEAHLSMIGSIYESGSRLLETLTGILDLSVFESSHEVVELKRSSVNALVQRHIEKYIASAELKGLEIVFWPSASDPQAKTKEDLAGRIIGHLISNAIKFSHQGSIVITTGETLVDEKHFTFVRVADSGIGIASEYLGLIFEEFRQVSEGTNRAYDGTGLGLHISQRFAQLLEGKITVESHPGVGSSFTLWLPSFVIDFETVHPCRVRLDDKASVVPADCSDPDKQVVLLVEDDEPSAILVKMILKDLFTIVRVSTGEDAIKTVAEQKVDAILMDINLGIGMSGLSAVEIIRAMPDYNHICIAAITANALDGHREEYLSGGCTHYLTKPYRRADLINLINEMTLHKQYAMMH